MHIKTATQEPLLTAKRLKWLLIPGVAENGEQLETSIAVEM